MPGSLPSTTLVIGPELWYLCPVVSMHVKRDPVTMLQSRVTPGEYLELERQAEYKSEYYNGEIFAMSGGSINHFHLPRRLGHLRPAGSP